MIEKILGLNYFLGLGYLGVGVLVYLLNLAPAFVPPTWVVLLMIYALDPRLDIFALTLVGAISSTLGRLTLTLMAKKMNFVLSEKEKEEMKIINKLLSKTKGFGFVSSLIVGLTPIPSNAYFIIIGLIGWWSFGVFAGFFAGRMITYFIPLALLKVSLKAINEIAGFDYLSRIVLDALGLVSIVIFLKIDWKKLLKNRIQNSKQTKEAKSKAKKQQIKNRNRKRY